MITVCAVRTGTKYPLFYVERLFASVSRHMTVGHDFCLITDDMASIPRVSGILAMRHTDQPGYWAKLEMFRPDWRWKSPLLYIDLDNVVVGSLDDLAECGGDLVGIRDWNLSDMMNSGVMRIKPGIAPEIWAEYGGDPAKATFRYRWGDQHLISRVAPGKITYWPAEWVPSWKSSTPEQHAAARVISFNGDPKPADLEDLPIVRDNWHV